MTAQIPLAHALWLGAILFAIGFLGVLLRRNLLFVIMSLELMLNAAGLAFVAAGAAHAASDGQVAFVFILCVAAAEVAVALALVLVLRRRLGSVDSDQARALGGG